jgi:hypothetical protein
VSILTLSFSLTFYYFEMAIKSSYHLCLFDESSENTGTGSFLSSGSSIEHMSFFFLVFLSCLSFFFARILIEPSLVGDFLCEETLGVTDLEGSSS